jgi:hypothetical protein
MEVAMDRSEARDALAAAEGAQARLATTMHCPPWRHAVFGGLFFALIGSIAVSSAAQFATLPFIVIALIVIMRTDRRRMGLFVNGYRRGATLPVTLGYVAVMTAFVAAAMALRVNDAGLLAKFGLAALAFALGLAFSVVWQRVYVRELTGRTAR